MKKEKFQNIRKLFDEFGVDAILVSTKSNIFYLSGFYGLSPLEREAYCFISKNNAFFITSPLYQHDIKQKDFSVIITSHKNTLIKTLGEIVEKEKIKTIGYESANITVAEFNRLQKINVKFSNVFLEDIRIAKEAEEIEKIHNACRIGDGVFEEICKKIKPGMTETKIASMMEISMREKGCLPSFPTIVAFGKHAAVPHHNPGEDTLLNNQFILLDFGVIYKGYCSDMTRTIFLGKISDYEKKAYEAVRVAQKSAYEKIGFLLKKGLRVKAEEIDKIARDYIVSKNFPDFPHSLGHGIGIDVHESPSLSPFSEELLQEGMVFSVEPGIYIPEKIGIRIEDLFTIQNNKLIKLTNSPVDLKIL